MLDGISLCISCPYQYEINDQDDDGNPIITRRIQNRLYRIADYSGGMFSLIDTHFSSLTTSFNPMYLREKRGSEQDLFKPVIMDWQFVQKRDDAEKGTTESFIDDSVTFYELIKIPDLIEIGDDTIIAKKLITGIPLPEHTANNFLIVISEDDLCYVVISCNQKNFRKMGNLYKIAGKIDDPLHAIHSLPSFVIRKSDIISTTNYKYLYSDPEAKVNIKPRFFYKYSYLPEIDGKLNLFTLSDYIPVQINKYLKFKSNSYDFTNAQKKAIISLIKEALELSDDFSDYLANGGYDKSTLQKELDFKTSEIISIISESDEFGSVINKVLKNDEQFKKQFIEEAKRIWLQEADEDRKSEEEKYQQIKNKEEMALEDLQVLSDKIEKQKR